MNIKKLFILLIFFNIPFYSIAQKKGDFEKLKQTILQGQIQEGIEGLKAYVKKFPDNTDASTYLAIVYYKKSEYLFKKFKKEEKTKSILIPEDYESLVSLTNEISTYCDSSKYFLKSNELFQSYPPYPIKQAEYWGINDSLPEEDRKNFWDYSDWSRNWLTNVRNKKEKLISALENLEMNEKSNSYVSSQLNTILSVDSNSLPAKIFLYKSLKLEFSLDYNLENLFRYDDYTDELNVEKTTTNINKCKSNINELSIHLEDIKKNNDEIQYKKYQHYFDKNWAGGIQKINTWIKEEEQYIYSQTEKLEFEKASLASIIRNKKTYNPTYEGKLFSFLTIDDKSVCGPENESHDGNTDFIPGKHITHDISYGPNNTVFISGSFRNTRYTNDCDAFIAKVQLIWNNDNSDIIDSKIASYFPFYFEDDKGHYNDNAATVIATKDGGAVSLIHSSFSGLNKILLVKINSDAKQEWDLPIVWVTSKGQVENRFGFPQKMLEDKDGNLLICLGANERNSYGGDYNIFDFIKISKNGSIIWRKSTQTELFFGNSSVTPSIFELNGIIAEVIDLPTNEYGLIVNFKKINNKNQEYKSKGTGSGYGYKPRFNIAFIKVDYNGNVNSITPYFSYEPKFVSEVQKEKEKIIIKGRRGDFSFNQGYNPNLNQSLGETDSEYLLSGDNADEYNKKFIMEIDFSGNLLFSNGEKD
ncbi:MAG: hypothetical protein M3Q58_01880 [Bacteroidota bacterium]|nr:hypothetical protein [Bacteroidota bacterium]